jgi:zinc transport system substrate-binding protein
MRSRRELLCIAATAAVFVSIAAEAAAEEPLEIWVSILPQHEIVDRLAGKLAHVEVLVKPGQSPATYEPTPKQMVGLENADLLIRVGVPFENSLLRRVADLVPDLQIVDGRRGIQLVPMAEDAARTTPKDHAAHQHPPGLPDPHFWLDPLLMKIHASTVSDALSERAPQHEGRFRSNLALLHSDLDAVHRRNTARLAPFVGRTFFTFHPAYGYFARRYGLRQRAVETGGKEPTARQLAQLVEAAADAGIHSVFVQPQFTGNAARAVAEAVGAELVELDPLAADYLSNLERMADRVAGALEE